MMHKFKKLCLTPFVEIQKCFEIKKKLSNSIWINKKGRKTNFLEVRNSNLENEVELNRISELSIRVGLKCAFFFCGMFISVYVNAFTYDNKALGLIENEFDSKNALICSYNFDSDGIKVVYNIPQVDLKDYGNGIYKCEIPEFGILGNNYEPWLPCKIESFLLPHDKEYTIRMNECEYVEYENIQIADLPSGIHDEVYNAESTYITSGFYPESIVESLPISMYRGHQIARLSVQPVQYDSGTRTLRVWNSVSFNIDFDDKDVSNSIYSDSCCDFVYDEMLNDLLTIKQSNNADKINSTGYPMLIKAPLCVIITHSSMRYVVNSYAEVKKEMGYNVSIIECDGLNENTIREKLFSIYNRAPSTIAYSVQYFTDFLELTTSEPVEFVFYDKSKNLVFRSIGKKARYDVLCFDELKNISYSILCPNKIPVRSSNISNTYELEPSILYCRNEGNALEVYLTNICDECMLIVTPLSINSDAIHTRKLPAVDKYSVKFDDLEKGIYVISLYCEGKMIESKKIVI